MPLSSMRADPPWLNSRTSSRASILT
jgi:hypothetical protein